jgi:ribonuclease-3
MTANKNKLMELQTLIGYQFKDLALLERAMTHKSYVHESGHRHLKHNERLEFFGDAVLKLVVSEYIMKKFPEQDEGELTKLRARAVSDNHLYKIGRDLGLGQYLTMSENERRTGGEKRKSNLANTVEALYGATYLDGGIEPASALILNLMKKSIDQIIIADEDKDYKSALQEWVQRQGQNLPEYKVLKETGPDHQKVFLVQVKVGKGLRRPKADGEGRTKKEAEQSAAKNLLTAMEKKSPKG